MSLADRVKVKCSGVDSEDLFFLEQEQEKLRALRNQAEQEANEHYREDHKNHCFRCGTPSLAVVEYGDVQVDICVNPGCGAIHLDPGELDALIKADTNAVKKVHVAFLKIFR